MLRKKMSLKDKSASFLDMKMSKDCGVVCESLQPSGVNETLLKARPTWDEYYLAIAYVVAQRSFDPSTKCGCVLVSKDNRLLSTGYNGPIKGSKDHLVPLSRPDKYFAFIHAETNALLAYNGSYQDISGATCYVTSRPCHNCLRSLLQKGITKIVYGGPAKARCVGDDDMRAQAMMLEDHPIEIKEINVDIIKSLLVKSCSGSEEGCFE